MKALVYTNPFEVTYREEPAPSVSDETLIKVEAVGICGSDLHAYQGHDARRNPPMILGHEIAGIVQTGACKGKRAVLNPIVACGRCEYCYTGRSNICSNRTMIGLSLPGGFAEQVAAPEQCLIIVPDDMDMQQAALTEPAATSLHGIYLAAKVLARPIAECNTLVIGGGSVGLLAALFLQDQGCEHIALAETNVLRRETAAKTGAVEAFDPLVKTVKDSGYDLVIDAVGAEPTRTMAVTAAKPGGVVLHIGLMNNDGGLDTRKLTLAEITFIGTYTYTRSDLEAAVKKIYSGALGDLSWLEARPLAEGARAFDDLLNGKCAAPKVVLQPQL